MARFENMDDSPQNNTESGSDNGQSSNDQNANDQNANDQNANDQNANDQNANDQNANDQNANDQNANDQGKKDGSLMGGKDDQGNTNQGTTDSVEYTDFTLPEGFSMNEALMEKFLPLAQKNKLTQEDAQSLIDMQVSHITEINKALDDDAAALQNKWQQQIKDHPELGGNNLNGNLTLVSQFIDKFSGSEKLAAGVRKAMDETGAGNRVEVLEFLVSLAKKTGEGKFVTGQPGATGDGLKNRYPNSDY